MEHGEGLQIVLHRTIPQDERLRQRWNELVGLQEFPQVFYTHEWASSVASAYSCSLIPLLILGYEANQLVGVASLATDSRKNRASFLAAATADYCDILSVSSHRERFVKSVFAAIRSENVGSLTLANLPEESLTTLALKAAAPSSGFHNFLRPAYRSAQVRLGSKAERETLSRSISSRKALRYALNSLGKQGEVSFRHHFDRESFEAMFPAYVQAHIARFSANGQVSNLASPERREFLVRLATLLLPQGWLRFSCMLVGERPIAWNYGFHFAGSWFYYQPTFESDVRQFSPGTCLLSRIIEDACEDSETEVVDLGIGAEGYKERFANAQCSTIHVEVSSSIMQRSRAALRYYAASSIKSVPAVEAGVRASLRAISNLSRYARAGTS